MLTPRFACTLLLIGCSGLQELTSARPPNVVVIVSDDQGSVDLGCYGSEDLVTPNTDRLEAEGVRFTQFYAAAPICSPSRAGLLTGRWPARAGVPFNCPSEKGRPGGLPPREITMAEMFRSAGYATAHIGKWHLGYTAETSPLNQGFDSTFGHRGGCIDNYSHFFFWQGPNRHDLWRGDVEEFHPGEFFPDLMLHEADQFISEHKDRPFFLYYAMNAPHYPYQGTPKWLKRFKDYPYPRNLYAAFLAAEDERVGGLLSLIEAHGLKEDTIVVFQSDNGHSTEERAHFGGGSAGELRGAKSSLFEGGIRVPAIISWPGHLPRRVVRDQISHGCDWMPTLAELTGVALPQVELDGRSLVPLLTDHPTDVHAGKALVWHVGTGANAYWAVREGDWKLIVNSRDTTERADVVECIPLFLANLREDPTESHNLADDYPDVVSHLRRVHERALE